MHDKYSKLNMGVIKIVRVIFASGPLVPDKINENISKLTSFKRNPHLILLKFLGVPTLVLPALASEGTSLTGQK